MPTDLTIVYRRAIPEELPCIMELMTAGNLDTRDLQPANILCAVVDGTIVGVNRIKRYDDGAYEIASAYVTPEFRKQGINQRLTEILRDECDGPVYAITNPINTDYIGKMGFVRLPYDAVIPASIRAKVDWCAAKYTTHQPGIFVFRG